MRISARVHLFAQTDLVCIDCHNEVVHCSKTQVLLISQSGKLDDKTFNSPP